MFEYQKMVCFWGDETTGHMGTNLKVILKSRFLNSEIWLNVSVFE